MTLYLYAFILLRILKKETKQVQMCSFRVFIGLFRDAYSLESIGGFTDIVATTTYMLFLVATCEITLSLHLKLTG